MLIGDVSLREGMLLPLLLFLVVLVCSRRERETIRLRL